VAKRGLLDRLQAGGSEPPDEVESIIEHLRVLLNTRKGEAVTVPGFGLVDFSDLVHTFPASISTLQASIRATILEFEPRLKNVTVRSIPDPDPLVLRFEIAAQPVQRNGKQSPMLRFHTQVTSGGQLRVGSEG
jgi:type VI secretion system protein